MKEAVWRSWVWAKAVAGGLALVAAGGAGGAGPRVFYGHRRLPSPAEQASGGIIKCQDLQRVFPNVPRRFNILYLVSSALPEQAPLLASFARRIGARVVLNQNGVAYPAWHGEGWERTNEPLRRLGGAADHVIYQSRFCRESAARFLGPGPGPSEVLHNPVDTSVFVPPAGRRDPRRLRILVAGSHGQLYRVAAAVEAFALAVRDLPPARLALAGRFCWGGDAGECLREVRRIVLAKGVGDLVDILGPYTQLEAVSLFQGADMLLHTTYNDACPRLVVEAMSCGLPVVYSASGGTPELVGGEAGIGVEAPRDWERMHPPPPRELAEAITRVAARRGTFAEAARERAVALFDVGPWLARHREIFEEVLA